MSAKTPVVDDELAIRRPLRNTLERAGYEIVEARNGKEAISAAAAEHPSAILLDLGLPDRGGLGLIPLLRRDGDTTVLVVSALDLGADDFVTKPFITEELLARVRVALRHRVLSTTTPR